MEFNIYSFLRIYTDISLQKASESEVNDMYNFLKDRTFGTDIEKSFTTENPLRLDKALAIDSVANDFSKHGNDLVQQVFPSAPYEVIEHTIENVSATMPWNEVAKLNHVQCGNYKCRPHVINEYLHRIKHPERNDEFI